MLHLLLLLQFALAAAAAAATPTSGVSVSCTDLGCTVEFPVNGQDDNVAATTYHRVELIPEETRLFTKATQFTLEGKDMPAPWGAQPRSLKRYHTKYDTKLWGTALIEDGNTLVDAIFLTETNGAVEFRNGEKVATKTMQHKHAAAGGSLRRLNDQHDDDDDEEEGEYDIVLELPEGKPWLDSPLATQGRNHSSSNNASSTTEYEEIGSSAEHGVINPFFPGCFPGDQMTHSFKINLVYDYGLVQDLTAGLYTDAAKLARVMQEAEHTFSVGKLIYRSQFNVNLELSRVILGTARDQVPVSRSSSAGTCGNALGAFKEMSVWNAKNYPADADHTMLISNCFSGVIGTSYIGSVCGVSNYGVTVNSYITLFHELGHAFGMNHKFYSGAGGIMDYGSGQYNGVVQFHYDNRAEVCPFLTYSKNAGTCKFFKPAAANSACGDGIMTKDEECECLDGSSKCGQCSQCKLLNRAAVECSSAHFVLRTSEMADMVVVQSSLLANPSCCTSSNKLAAAKTLCGDGKLNACSANGACVSICSEFLSYNNPNCGFDASGCVLGCVFSSKCRYDFTVLADNGQRQNLAALPNGSRCLLNGRNGLCHSTKCLSTSAYESVSNGGSDQVSDEDEDAPSPTPTINRPIGDSSPPPPELSTRTKSPTTTPTRKPTKAPTLKPSKKPTGYPTKKPTKSPTGKPTKKPTMYPTNKPSIDPANKVAVCSTVKSRVGCLIKSGCSWCTKAKACRPTGDC